MKEKMSNVIGFPNFDFHLEILQSVTWQYSKGNLTNWNFHYFHWSFKTSISFSLHVDNSSY